MRPDPRFFSPCCVISIRGSKISFSSLSLSPLAMFVLSHPDNHIASMRSLLASNRGDNSRSDECKSLRKSSIFVFAKHKEIACPFFKFLYKGFLMKIGYSLMLQEDFF
jgi:hypothetical protein